MFGWEACSIDLIAVSVSVLYPFTNAISLATFTFDGQIDFSFLYYSYKSLGWNIWIISYDTEIRVYKKVVFYDDKKINFVVSTGSFIVFHSFMKTWYFIESCSLLCRKIRYSITTCTNKGCHILVEITSSEWMRFLNLWSCSLSRKYILENMRRLISFW